MHNSCIDVRWERCNNYFDLFLVYTSGAPLAGSATFHSSHFDFSQQVMRRLNSWLFRSLKCPSKSWKGTCMLKNKKALPDMLTDCDKSNCHKLLYLMEKRYKAASNFKLKQNTSILKLYLAIVFLLIIFKFLTSAKMSSYSWKLQILKKFSIKTHQTCELCYLHWLKGTIVFNLEIRRVYRPNVSISLSGNMMTSTAGSRWYSSGASCSVCFALKLNRFI